ncbi:MAG: FtsX-like permease family protein [SAR202 cluster bacterium]|nr:FtsX-like permease family protein [SAR202 cluster bacterium]
MNPLITCKVALASLGANKLRAGLTLLGIVIGVAAVISLMAIGRGVQESITSRIESLGTNLVFVRPGSTTQRGVSGGLGSATTLTLDDAYALKDPVYAPLVKEVAPELTTTSRVVAGRVNTSTRVVGVTPEYQSVRNFPVTSGRFIAQGDVDQISQVAVLGSQTSQTLFGFQDPVGQVVRINNRQFTVIGVLESKGATASLGFLDDQVLVPITTSYYRLSSQRTSQGDINVQTINVSMNDAESVDESVQQIATVLRLRHRITGEDDFSITNQQEAIDTLRETTNTFVVFLGTVAGISLLVGGIGIMNIMLVTVTERTREIGIRKAMGARRRDILLQFVLEATFLSLGGGGVGVVLGIVLTRLLNGKALLSDQPTQTAFSGDIALLALAVSAAIGLFFGIYTALRAARLHPIEALRHE